MPIMEETEPSLPRLLNEWSIANAKRTHQADAPTKRIKKVRTFEFRATQPKPNLKLFGKVTEVYV